MKPMTRARALVLLHAPRSTRRLVREFGSMRGVARVDAVRGPYDLVVHAEADQVEAIMRLPGVIAADVCWLSHSSGGCR
jgi:uncharacterized protein with GYD domain